MVPLDFDKQIPKGGDQRQMENWQRVGTYTAGLALDDAGIAGNTEILAHTHMVVAAAGGERDLAVDQTILEGVGNGSGGGRSSSTSGSPTTSARRSSSPSSPTSSPATSPSSTR